MTKVCTKCKTEKPLAAFHRNATKPAGRTERCSQCKNALHRDWYKNGGHKKLRNNQLRKDFGVTLAEYDHRVAIQLGLCAICGQRPSGGRPNLSIDHNHATGEQRELLCMCCNIGLGQFKDDPARLEQAAAYLRRHEKTTRGKSCPKTPAA